MQIQYQIECYCKQLTRYRMQRHHAWIREIMIDHETKYKFANLHVKKRQKIFDLSAAILAPRPERAPRGPITRSSMHI